MRLTWMKFLPVYNAEGVDGGGSDGGAAPVAGDGATPPASPGTGGDAGSEKPDDKLTFKVAVDGTVPAKPGDEGAADPAQAAGEADPAKEGEGDKADGEKDEKVKDEFPHKPEDYTFQLPDGAEPDPAQAQEFAAFAVENKVPPELAQKLVDFHATVMQEKIIKPWINQVNAWGEQTKSDPEYGGAAYEANMGIANQALSEFGSPALGEAARTHGWGNHPEFVRFMWNVGKALGYGSTEKGGELGNVGNQIDPTKALYGDTK